MISYLWALTVADAYGRIAQNLNRTYRSLFGVDPLEHHHQWRSIMYLYGTPRFGGRSKNRIEDTIDIIIKYDKWEFYVYRENQDHLKTPTKTDQLKIKYERK
eukprot:472881_1